MGAKTVGCLRGNVILSVMGSDNSNLDDARMPLAGHLNELRRRLIMAIVGLLCGMAAGFFFARDVLTLLNKPYRDVCGTVLGSSSANLFVFSVLDGFQTYMQLAFYIGLIVSSPWLFYQAWRFVSAGLLPRERRLVVLAAPASAILFLAGVAFFIFVAAEPMLLFLVGFNNWMGFTIFLRPDDYISFMTSMLVVFGLAFQTPLVVLMLSWMGIVGLRGLNKYRRHVIVGMFILAAIATPSASPVDQIMLAIPLWMLYELGVLLTWIFVTRRATAK